MSDQPIKIVIVGPSKADADTVEPLLRQAGLVFTIRLVATMDALIEALDDFRPDVVLVECRMHVFDELSIIKRVRQKSAELPIILITSALGDEAAVALIKAGANDYILNDDLDRLPAAVRRALIEAQTVRSKKQAEEALRLSEERYRSLVVAISQIVWTTNANGEIVEDLPAWRTFTGQTAEQMKGNGWLAALHPDDRDRIASAWSAAVRARTLFEVEYRLRRYDGEYRDVSVRGVPVIEQDFTIREWVGVCSDVTERKRHEEQLAAANARIVEVLHEQAIRDPLTGLFNRQYLDETLEREIRRSQRIRAPLAVVMLDIDHFKTFNDTYGHAAGDEVLKTLGKVLRDTVRASDVACRYGGEEFVVVLLDADLAAAIPSVERICSEIRRRRCVYRGQTLPAIKVSAGIAQYPVHGTSVEALLSTADEAMYAAKNAGRDRIEIASAHLAPTP